MKRLVPLVSVLIVLAAPLVAAAQGHGDGTVPPLEPREHLSADNRTTVAAFVACAVAFITGISVLGAAYAVAHVGSAAIGAASEKPEMMGRSLIFVALGEGLAVLGLAVAFVLLFMVLTELIR
jgi:V/A-type H+-transporting ATPase subunit K